MITKRIQGYRNSGVDQIHVTLTVTTTTVTDTTFTATGTFTRAFAAAPLVIGSNASIGGQAASAAVTATGIEVYVVGGDPSLLPDGDITVAVTLEGEVTNP